MQRWSLCVVVGLGYGCAWGQQAPTPQPAVPPLQEQVTVTTERSGAAVGEAAKTVYELTEKDLAEYPAVTLDEALRQHAGFELFRRSSSRVQNPTSQGISLRGLGSTAASRTLVLEDGAPLNDAFGGWIHWNENPAGTVEAVTLVSGGGSDLYGSSALGGVIDVTPLRPEATTVVGAVSEGSQQTGDYDGLIARRGALLAGEVLRTAGYVQTNPVSAGLVDVASNVHSAAFRTELGHRVGRDSRVFLSGNVLNEARGNGTPIQSNATRLWRYQGGWESAADARVSGRVRAFGSDEGYRQSFSSIAVNRSSEVKTRFQRVETQELGATGDGTVRIGWAALVFGADVRDIRAADNEVPYSAGRANGIADTSARQRFFGGFGELLGAKGKWSGAASLRGDGAQNLHVRQFNGTPGAIAATTLPNRTEGVVSPRIGLVRDLGRGIAVHATGFRAFRTPTMNELYRSGQVGQQLTLANSALKSERATGWEVGLEAAHVPRLGALTATYFWTEINRPVSAVLIASTPTTMTNLRENLGQIRSDGVELALRVREGKPISGALGYQFADATVTKFSATPALVGNWIPDVPRNSGTGQVRFRSDRLGELTVAGRVGGKAFDDSSNIYPLAKFFEMDVSGRRSLGKHAEAFFVVENVTNVRQQVSRTPVLTLGSPVFGEGGVRVRIGN